MTTVRCSECALATETSETRLEDLPPQTASGGGCGLSLANSQDLGRTGGALVHAHSVAVVAFFFMSLANPQDLRQTTHALIHAHPEFQCGIRVCAGPPGREEAEGFQKQRFGVAYTDGHIELLGAHLRI